MFDSIKSFKWIYRSISNKHGIVFDSIKSVVLEIFAKNSCRHAWVSGCCNSHQRDAWTRLEPHGMHANVRRVVRFLPFLSLPSHSLTLVFLRFYASTHDGPEGQSAFADKDDVFEEEQWEEGNDDRAVFEMRDSQDDKGGGRRGPRGPADEDREHVFPQTNPRFEFQPHIRSMDQFHIREIIRIGRHMKAMKGGRQMSFSALALAGNGNGSAALGYGKALKVQDAVRAANLDAEKNMVHIKRFQGYRNVHNTVVRDKGCIVFKKAIADGVKGNYLAVRMCEAFGIDGVSIKILGPRSKNLATRAKTVFKAISMQRDPEAEAHAMGRMLFNANKVWRRRDYESIY